MSPRHRLYPIDYVATTLCLLAVLWLTLAPDPVPSTGVHLIPHSDKIVHALMFGGLLSVWAVERRCHGKAVTTRLLTLAAFVTIALGGVIEVLQEGMQLGRSGEWSDLLADTTGIAIAWTVFEIAYCRNK